MRHITLLAAAAAMFIGLFSTGCSTNDGNTLAPMAKPTASTATPVAKANLPQQYRGGGANAGQPIPAIPGLRLGLFQYDPNTGFGSELSANMMAARYETLEGKIISLSLCLGNRGGISNRDIAYWVYDQSGNYFHPIEGFGHTAYNLRPGRYTAWAGLIWNGAPVEIGVDLLVNEDPDRPNLWIGAMQVVDHPSLDCKVVSFKAGNGKPGTVAHDIRIQVTMNADGTITAKATDGKGLESSPVTTGFVINNPTLVPEKVWITTESRGGPGGVVYDDPKDLNRGVMIGDLIGGGSPKGLSIWVTDGNFLSGGKG